jgi:hypothetical protein
MFNLNKSIIASFMSFSTSTLILPIILGVNVDRAMANDMDAIKTCDRLRSMIKATSAGSPKQEGLVSIYSSRNCHRYLKNRVDARNCEKILAEINNINTSGAGAFALRSVYNPACINPADEE